MQTALPLSPLSHPVLLLPALREGTRDLHERLESRLDIAARFDSRDDYQTLLERFYGLYTPLEEILATPECAVAWAALGIDFGCRRKAGLLESDLRAFGMTAADLAGLARCPTDLLLTPSSEAELVGCAYVLEGATLGGQVIGRHLERTLGLRPGDPGGRFFHGYGSRTGAMWQQFRHAAEAFGAGEEATRSGDGTRVAKQATEAARRTFAAMEAWLISEGDVFPLQ